jgi:glycolate oxidase
MSSPGPVARDGFLTATELIAKAHERLSLETWDYVAGAAESETTKRRNREAIEEWVFRPRVLRNVRTVDAATTLLGTKLRIPVVLAPMGSLETLAPGGAVNMVEAAAQFGTLPIVSSVTAPALEDSAAAARCDKWFQLYIRGDFAWISEMVQRIRAAGYAALVLTVDAAWYSIRDRQLHLRWNPPSRSRGTSGEKFQALLDWDMVARIKDIAGMPLVLKGIQTAEDAEIAVRQGIDVIYVSNHGGRHLDHAKGALAMFFEIVEQIGRKVPILVDGGFLRGPDVVKAVALGAAAVGLGRIQAYAMAADGANGIIRLLEILEGEMKAAMAMMGVTAVAQLDRTLVERIGPPAGGVIPFPFLPDGIRL